VTLHYLSPLAFRLRGFALIQRCRLSASRSDTAPSSIQEKQP